MHISKDGKRITMRAPDDWHTHLRQGALLVFLVMIFLRYGWRRRIVLEPNTLPPKTTGPLAVAYKAEVHEAAQPYPHGLSLEPIAVLQITESTTPAMVREAYQLGVRICKVYPLNVTTNSANGVFDYEKIYPALAEAERLGMIVQFHGEHPSYDFEGEEKEREFIDRILAKIVHTFPNLKVTLEHVSSAYGVEWVKRQGDNVAAGVTIQHLTNTIDDLIGYSERSRGKICVHEGFKPQAKKRADRKAIQDVVLEGHPRFLYAGDPAWHGKKNKQEDGACGAANTIAALDRLVRFFKGAGKIEQLEKFVSEYGANFYGYPLNEETIELINEPGTIPREIEVPGLNDVVVPWGAGEPTEWQVVE